MKILIINRPEGPPRPLYQLLTGSFHPDLLVVLGSVCEELAPLLRQSIRPILRVCAVDEDPGADCGWPVTTPLGLIYDQNLRLVVSAAAADEQAVRDLALRYRATLCIAPALSGKSDCLISDPQRGYSVATLGRWPEEHLRVENFFSSVQVSRYGPEITDKLAEVSFFW